MDSGGWIRLFSLWTLIVAGIVLNMDFENRYVYWSWSGWESGFVKLVVASVVYFYFLNPNNLWIIGSKRLQNKEIIIHAVIAFILLIFGYVGLAVQWFQTFLGSSHILLLFCLAYSFSNFHLF